MDDAARTFLAQLRHEPMFHAVVKEIKTFRPVVPGFAPGASEETYHLLERIKYESGRRAGFDLAMQYLTGEKSE